MSYAKIEKNLLSALKSPKLDESDFILLSARLLEKKLGTIDGVNDLLQQIRAQYLVQDYKGALDNISSLYLKHQSILGDSVVKSLEDARAQLKSDPNDNESRRFYETLYAAHLDLLLKSETDFSMFDELKDSYNAIKPEYALEITNTVSNFDDARTLIMSFMMLNDNIELPLKAKSDTYKKKDRSRADLGTTLSDNPGIMKPNSPNFADNLIPTRKLERTAIDERVNDGYSKTNTQIPFVTSFSGTTFSLVVVLQNYIEKHKDDSKLEEKVNTIIKLWISAYIKDGYHSYAEIVDVLKEPKIQSIFTDAHIKLDYAIIPDTTDEFHKAQDYALGTATKFMMHQELLQTFEDKKIQEEKLKQAVSNFGEVLNKLNKDMKIQDKYPEQLKKLSELHQNLGAGNIDYELFKRECTQLLSTINPDELTDQSWGELLRKVVNTIISKISFGYFNEVISAPPNFSIQAIGELKDALEQIKDLSKPKTSYSDKHKNEAAEKTSETIQKPATTSTLSEADLPVAQTPSTATKVTESDEKSTALKM